MIRLNPFAALLLFLFAALATPAFANPFRAVENAYLERSIGERSTDGWTEAPSPLAERLDAPSTPAPRFDLVTPILLTPSALTPPAALRPATLGLRPSDSVWYFDEELPPDTLELRFELHPTLRFLLSADLSSELPRLDALDGETYFIAGLEFRVTPRLAVFLEDFQPSSGIVGGANDEEPAPARSWDGHQVALGLRHWASERVRCDVAAVGYVLSRTRREESLGGYFTLTFVF